MSGLDSTLSLMGCGADCATSISSSAWMGGYGGQPRSRGIKRCPRRLGQPVLFSYSPSLPQSGCNPSSMVDFTLVLQRERLSVPPAPRQMDHGSAAVQLFSLVFLRRSLHSAGTTSIRQKAWALSPHCPSPSRVPLKEGSRSLRGPSAQHQFGDCWCTMAATRAQSSKAQWASASRIKLTPCGGFRPTRGGITIVANRAARIGSGRSAPNPHHQQGLAGNCG